MKKRVRGAIAILLILLSFVPAGAGYGADATPPPGASAEEREIDAAARKYLDAEVARELKTVYDCLAPSSIYRATHDYDAYLTQTGASPVRIREYQILRITQIRVNEDKKAYPRVEKFAQVEVDMKVFFTDTNQAAEVNFNFTFIKEGGRWYKG
ncbi:MAG: hypothetical protein CVU53_01070 [Deltaproteobacteria bacterium HGW-Deltaproteobacteria-11]|nr:MAG: hypothetical protein CVU53_01070 [Deltaproteobacteria bacterium HGW-Deltaproteobacteria-11]